MTPRSEIVARLRQVPLFSRLRLTDLEALAALVRRVEYTPGAIVYRQGEPGSRYYIVHRGLLRATRLDADGEVAEVRRLGPGDAVGETSLLLGDVHDVTVEAVDRSLLLYIERDAFEEFLRQHPRVERMLCMRPEVAERRRYPRFKWLQDEESAIKIVRKHPVLLAMRLVVPSALLGLAILGWVVGARVPGVGIFIALLAFLPALIGLASAFFSAIDWRNDVYVVTNERVAHRERVGVFQEERISAAPLRAIQDVYISRVGILAHLFDFGDLTVETAGGAGRVVFIGIPQPDAVRETIFDQRTRALAWARLRQRQMIRQMMRRHLFRETEEETAAEVEAESGEAPSKMRGCLLFFLSLAAYFIPRPWEQEGDTVTWRKHWIGLLKTAGAPFALLALAPVGVVAATAINSAWFPSAALACAVTYVLVFPVFLWFYEDWRNDYYQVTASRIVHVERQPLLLREERREASLDQITNVRTEQSMWGRLLGYGDVIVETAAPAGAFHFRMVQRPSDVQKEIFSHISAARRRREEQQAKQRRAEILDSFVAYEELRRERRLSPREGGEE